MPRWSRWMVRMALVHLVLALGLGVLSSVPVWAQRFAWLATAAPSIFHLLVVGWATQMIFGVAYWMFPRTSRTMPYGSEFWSGVVCLGLNLGLLLRLIAEPMLSLSNLPFWSWMLVGSAVLQWMAGAIFVATIWRRVREK